MAKGECMAKRSGMHGKDGACMVKGACMAKGVCMAKEGPEWQIESVLWGGGGCACRRDGHCSGQYAS